VSEYKEKTMYQLIADEAVLLLMDEPDIVEKDPSELIYNNVFPYKRIPGTQEEAKVFIMIAVDIPSVSSANCIIKEMLLTITVVCHEGKMRTAYGGTRVDLLAAAIQNILNGTKAFNGNKLEYTSDIEGVFINGGWFYRELKFRAGEKNYPRCGNRYV
jgi:hypothetical protein